MSIQSIIGGQALALNVLRMIPPIFQRDVGLRPLLAHTLRLAKAESMSHQQDAVDGLPRRHRGRTACLGRIGSFSQILTSYVWNTPGARLRARAIQNYCLYQAAGMTLDGRALQNFCCSH